MKRSFGATVTGAGTVLSLASLALVLDNLRRLRTPRPGAEPAAETLAVLVPVRDEVAAVGGCLRALAASAARWPGPVRVIVLDDESTDGTRAELDRLAPELGVEVVRGASLPPGWLGKPWACQQLAGAAAGAGVLVFVDADVRVAPHALTATVALLRESGLDLVCPYPRQEARGAAERLLQPLLQWSWMSTLPLGPAERSSRLSLVAANGQLLAVDAAAYSRAGGHAGVRTEVLEDLALLRAVKRSGGRGVVADGSDLASCRMYDGWSSLRAGYGKSLWSAFGSPTGALAVGSLLVLTHVVPAVAAARGSRTGLVGYAAGVVARILVARRWGARAHPEAWAHPVAVLAFVGLLADSFVQRAHGRLAWRGRPVEVGR